MKIALCLHGYFDSQRDANSKGLDGFNHIKKHILDGNNVDIFIHSWDLPNKEKIISLYENWIIDAAFEEQIDFVPLCRENGLDHRTLDSGRTHFKNVFSQFYSVQRAFELMLESGLQYDCVIKARFDLGRINRLTSGPQSPQNPYPVQCINFDPTLPMDKFYMADWQYFETEGPADMWFYSSQENMEAFAGIYDALKADLRIDSPFEEWAGPNDGGMMNSIKALKWFFIQNGLWDKKQPLNTTWE